MPIKSKEYSFLFSYECILSFKGKREITEHDYTKIENSFHGVIFGP